MKIFFVPRNANSWLRACLQLCVRVIRMLDKKLSNLYPLCSSDTHCSILHYRPIVYCLYRYVVFLMKLLAESFGSYPNPYTFYSIHKAESKF